ncbi:MAG: C39 family peptidase [Synergistaceae bacterium]|nr:C39 family peptidase [Synergistaceae bacterium]
MKKLLIALLIVMSLSSFAAAEPVKVIPYPAGIDTKTEGASSAPQSINHKYSIYFDTMTDYFELQSNERRIILSNFPTYRQTKENTCDPAAALTVLYYYGNTDYTEAGLVLEMKTQPYPIDTNPKDILAFFERLGWTTDSSLTHKRFEDYDSFKNFIIENLKNNIPIMVETSSGAATGA